MFSKWSLRSASFLLASRARTQFLAITIVLCLAATGAQASQYITIASGGVVGGCYAFGRVICDIINRELKDQGISCIAKATQGISYNLGAVERGKADFGFTQAVWVAESIDDPARTKVAQVLNFGEVPIVFLVRRETSVTSFSQLTSLVFNKGHKGSAGLAFTEKIMQYYNWHDLSFPDVTSYRTSQVTDAFCSAKVGAMSVVLFQPNNLLHDVINSCDVTPISMPEDLITYMETNNQYVHRYRLPTGVYSPTQSDIDTISSSILLVARQDLDSELVYKVTKIVREHLPQINNLVPIEPSLEEDLIFKPASNAPLHSGVIKLLSEAPTRKQK